MTSHATSARLLPTAVVALAAGLLLSGCSLGDGYRKTARADTEVTEAVTAVEVTEGRSGSVEVTPGKGPGVTVRRVVHYRGDARPTPGRRVSDGVLTFSDGCTGSCSVDYRLEVPASATVRVDNSSGRISVTGVAGAELVSDSGTVRAERIAGPLKVRTSSGDITAAALGGPSADIRSGSGDVRADFTTAPDALAVRTSSGDVTLRVPAGPYRVDVSTDSGTRDVSVPTSPSAGARLSAKTSSGDVRISAP